MFHRNKNLSFILNAFVCVLFLSQFLINETNGKYIRSSSSSSSIRSLDEELFLSDTDVDLYEDEADNDDELMEALIEEMNEEEASENDYYISVEPADKIGLDSGGEEVEDAFLDVEGYYDDENVEDFDPSHGYEARPIMHTFYQHIDINHHKTGSTFNKGTGMRTDEAHLALLAVWESSWQKAGFETRILDINDAMQHEDYGKVREFLDNEEFGEYDEICFLRWFAMASVGGGWMSDYDVVPLASLVPYEYVEVPTILSDDDIATNNGIPLPHDGRFTAYDERGQVPSLLSGSQEEWERLAQGLINLTYQHTKGFYSDMLALDDYDTSIKDAFEKEAQVLYRLSDVMSDGHRL